MEQGGPSGCVAYSIPYGGSVCLTYFFATDFPCPQLSLSFFPYFVPGALVVFVFQIRAWAVYLSLADLDGLFEFADAPGQPGQKKRLMDVGNSILKWLSSKFSDSREGVRVHAVEAWERFAISTTARCSPDQV